MISLTTIISLLAIHFIMDFLFQNDYMAINKSKKNEVLFIHCLIYSAGFIYYGVWFVIITLITHFIIDYITSRINTKLYNNYRHWFFCCIGFDQFIHVSLLMVIYNVLN